MIVADDENLLRSAVASFLERSGRIEVVAEVADGAQAILATRRLMPEVVLMDFEMPKVDGIEASSAILRANPQQNIVMLTRHARPGVLRRALRVGVTGFVPKSIDPARLVDIVCDTAAGHRYIDPEVSSAAMTDDCPLSEREIEVLRLTDEGLTVREMANLIHLAPGTIRNYLSSALSKTSTSSRLAAMRVAKARDWL